MARLQLLATASIQKLPVFTIDHGINFPHTNGLLRWGSVYDIKKQYAKDGYVIKIMLTDFEAFVATQQSPCPQAQLLHRQKHQHPHRQYQRRRHRDLRIHKKALPNGNPQPINIHIKTKQPLHNLQKIISMNTNNIGASPTLQALSFSCDSTMRARIAMKLCPHLQAPTLKPAMHRTLSLLVSPITSTSARALLCNGSYQSVCSYDYLYVHLS